MPTLTRLNPKSALFDQLNMQSSLRKMLACTSSFEKSLSSTTRRRVLILKSLRNPAICHSRHQTTLFNRTLSTPINLRRLSCPIRDYSSQITDIVFPDPNRPDLFYHLVHAPTPLSDTLPVFALSFLNDSPPSVDSPTVIGWIPAQTYETDAPEGDSQPAERTAALPNFAQNDKFVKFLHETIKAGLAEGVDDLWKDQAIGLQSGWMHIHDQRNIPPLDRIGDPDDIIATVLVQDSQILVDTYQPMPAYRVYTADGVMQLTPGLSNYLQNKLLDLTKSGNES